MLAQPILNSTDIDYTGTVTSFTANPIGFTTGQDGANQIWNYSAIAVTQSAISTGLQVTTAPFETSFPTANYIIKSTTSNTDLFGFFNITSTKLELLGLASSALILVNFNPNPQTQFEFPFTYDLTVNDSYSTINDPTAINPFTLKYDAYGTIVTPFDTFNNSYRIKKLDGIFPEYTWYQQNTNKSILRVVFGSTGVTSVTFYQQNNLKIEEFNKSNIKIYPNPTNDYIIIENTNSTKNLESYNLTDITGKILKTDKIYLNQKIDISNFNQGLYFIEVTNEDGSVLNQKVLKK